MLVVVTLAVVLVLVVGVAFQRGPGGMAGEAVVACGDGKSYLGGLWYQYGLCPGQRFVSWSRSVRCWKGLSPGRGVCCSEGLCLGCEVCCQWRVEVMDVFLWFRMGMVAQLDVGAGSAA